MFDPATLIAIVVMLGAILSLCLIGLRHTLPASIGGLYPWAFAMLALAGAALLAFLVSSRSLDADFLVLGGFAYVGAWVAIVVSLRRFTGRPTPLRGGCCWACLSPVRPVSCCSACRRPRPGRSCGCWR